MRIPVSLGITLIATAIACVTARGHESEPTLTVTLYPAECRVEVVKRKCANGEARPLIPSTYTLYLETQRVKQSTRDHYDTWHNHCEISDVDNWLCFYDGDSGAMGIEKGIYWSVSFEKDPAAAVVDGVKDRVEVVSTFNWNRWRTHTFYVSKEKHEALEMEFGPRQLTID